MQIIAHRGNLTGPNRDRENMSSYVREAVKAGFGVEIDLWGKDRQLLMGHDSPIWVFNPALFSDKELWQIWFHCKNDAAEHYCKFAGFNHFRHEGMPRITTYMGETWHYPGATLQGGRPIACLPETVPDWDISGAWGICTDYPIKYREMYK